MVNRKATKSVQYFQKLPNTGKYGLQFLASLIKCTIQDVIPQSKKFSTLRGFENLAFITYKETSILMHQNEQILLISTIQVAHLHGRHNFVMCFPQIQIFVICHCRCASCMVEISRSCLSWSVNINVSNFLSFCLHDL